MRAYVRAMCVQFWRIKMYAGVCAREVLGISYVHYKSPKNKGGEGYIVNGYRRVHMPIFEKKEKRKIENRKKKKKRKNQDSAKVI